MKEIWISIQSYSDREKIIVALANSGYSVTTKTEEDNNRDKLYWVIFELPDLNIKGS